MIMDLPVLVLTPGEPAGIGPECAVRLAHSHPEFRLIMVADRALLHSTAERLNIPFKFTNWQPGQAVQAGVTACYEVPLRAPAISGKLELENAEYVLDCLRHAVRLVRTGQAGALVTGPVHKGVINDAGIPFQGHTEFLAELSGVSRVVMMLATDELRVALVTTHLPLRDVPDAITREAVLETIRITNSELRQRFGINRAHLQVLGLNPHAGEGGHLGREDGEIIAPAIETCLAEGISVTGPVPADTAFTRSALSACDGVIAMYHDQGLPVLKHAGFGKSVNVTLGLPFIRTSVDHGTALDIAGSGKADSSSLYQAVSLAQRMCSDSRA